MCRFEPVLLLQPATDQTGVEEIVVQNRIVSPDHVLRSHELLADAFDLTPW